MTDITAVSLLSICSDSAGFLPLQCITLSRHISVFIELILLDINALVDFISVWLMYEILY